jgi:hypothetical protein
VETCPDDAASERELLPIKSEWVPRHRAFEALIQADEELRDEIADAVGGRLDELFYAAARGRA